MALFLEPRPSLGPVAYDVLADDVLIAGSGAVMPIVVGDIAVRPPLRAYLIVGVVGFRSASYGSVPGVLDGDFACDGSEAFDSRGDSIGECTRVVGGVAHDVEAVALVVAAPFLVADVEGDTGRVDGNVIAHRALQLPLDDAADLGGITSGGGTVEDNAWCAATTYETASP